MGKNSNIVQKLCFSWKSQPGIDSNGFRTSVWCRTMLLIDIFASCMPLGPWVRTENATCSKVVCLTRKLDRWKNQPHVFREHTHTYGYADFFRLERPLILEIPRSAHGTAFWTILLQLCCVMLFVMWHVWRRPRRCVADVPRNPPEKYMTYNPGPPNIITLHHVDPDRGDGTSDSGNIAATVLCHAFCHVTRVAVQPRCPRRDP